MPKNDDARNSNTAALRGPFRIVCSVIAAWGLSQILFGERMSHLVSDGLGWDGAVYGAWAKLFWSLILVDGVPNEYYAHRILPSFLVHHVLLLFKRSDAITNWDVIKCFQAFNLALALLCIELWRRICAWLGFSVNRFLFGSIALTCNFAFLKMPFYYPVLTDSFALLLGMLLTYAALTRKLALAWIATIASAFTWTTSYYAGLAVLLFWWLPQQPTPGDRALSKKWAKIAAWVSGLAVVALWAHVYMMAKADPTIVIFREYGRVGNNVSCALLAAFVAACAYCFVVSLRIPAVSRFAAKTRSKSIWSSPVGSLPWFPPVAAIATIALVNALVTHLSQGRAFVVTSLIPTIMARGVAFPAVHLVAHVAYFGPLIILCVWKWPALSGAFQRHFGSMGAVLMMTFLPWTISSESRAIINFFPLIVVALAAGLDEKLLTRRNLGIFAAISIAASKCWLAINPAKDPPPSESIFVTFKNYFINFGSCFSADTYQLNLGISVVLCIVMALIFRGWRRVSV